MKIYQAVFYLAVAAFLGITGWRGLTEPHRSKDVPPAQAQPAQLGRNQQ